MRTGLNATQVARMRALAGSTPEMLQRDLRSTFDKSNEFAEQARTNERLGFLLADVRLALDEVHCALYGESLYDFGLQQRKGQS